MLAGSTENVALVTLTFTLFKVYDHLIRRAAVALDVHIWL